MATAETVQMGPNHPPKCELFPFIPSRPSIPPKTPVEGLTYPSQNRHESIKAFNEIAVELKTLLQHLRHETNKHEPQYFEAVSELSDRQLTNFSGENPRLVYD